MIRALGLINIASIAYAHSWVACTNYITSDTDYRTMGTFDRNKCAGYPRAFDLQYRNELATEWGVDTGYNWEHDNCRSSFNPQDYTDTIRMATYSNGAAVHISHPSKNHVADTCTNQFIPSESLKLMMSSQPTVDTFDISVPMIGKEHVNGQIDHLGYQNCYQFCQNMDKSHCLTSWQLPHVSTSGRYSFMWIWQFNPHQFYTTCFDAMITTDDSQTPASTTVDSPTIIPTTTLVPNGQNTTPAPTATDTITFPPTPALTTDTITFPPTPAPTTDTITFPPTPAPTEPKVQCTFPDTPEPTIASSPTDSPTDSPTKSPTLITSDAAQIRSIVIDALRSIHWVFNGTMFAT